ncbi:MAG TPA: tryptophan synthase subunit alpha [bacterium]|nr:tryptophan synthase subunit alpha [bacterium]
MISYQKKYSELKSKNEGALVPFTVLGDPDYENSLLIIREIINNGADVLELGMPFSDPIADGPTIQSADTRALESGINIHKCISLLEEIRKFSEIPIGLLLYSNLILNYGLDKFYKKMAAIEINSVLIADVPVEEAGEFISISQKFGIDTVFLVTPLTPEIRLEKIIRQCTGFVYLVARLGVTGARQDLEDTTLKLIQKVRPKTDLPINVGFGISQPEHIQKVIQSGADGAIVGSALINRIENNLSDQKKMQAEIGSLIKELKQATYK